MPRALTPQEVAERAMQKREARNRQVSGETKKNKTGKNRAERAYTIRYGVMNPKDFEQRVLVWKNPAYGNPVGEHGTRALRPCAAHMRELEAKTGFYSKLETSLKEEGVRNPIFALSLPEGTFCRYGTSRLWIARKLGIKLPAIIADFDGRWDKLEELFTEEDVLSRYKDAPGLVEITPDSMRIDGCPQTHLNK
jgi:hypothetical protein